MDYLFNQLSPFINDLTSQHVEKTPTNLYSKEDRTPETAFYIISLHCGVGLMVLRIQCLQSVVVAKQIKTLFFGVMYTSTRFLI